MEPHISTPAFPAGPTTICCAPALRAPTSTTTSGTAFLTKCSMPLRRPRPRDRLGQLFGLHGSPGPALSFGKTRAFDQSIRFLRHRHHIHFHIQLVPCAAQQHAVDRTDIAVIAPPSHGDMAVRGYAIVGGI